MSITFTKRSQTFKLDTAHTSHLLQVAQEGYLVDVYYGSNIPDEDVPSYARYMVDLPSFHPQNARIPDPFSMDVNPLAYPGFGTGDFRRSAIRVRNAVGNNATDFRYVRHQIIDGKPPIPGLPSTTAAANEAQTLAITLQDTCTGLELTLRYTVFEAADVITHSAVLRNGSTQPVVIEDISSCFVNLPSMAYSMVNLYGRHNYERNIESRPLAHGLQSIVSRRGASSHEQNPFLALIADGSDEEHGDTYGFNFVYSGSFRMDAEVDFHESTVVSVGFNPEQFSWVLGAGEVFHTPETVAVYTNGGIGEMSRLFHRFYNRHLIRGRYRTEQRPLLINSWEAAYFNFDEEKLVNFARQAKELGIDMLVMDDGWFGHRDNDGSSLGDWYEYSEKIQLESLVRRVKKLGLKFGIWYEPEMISKDSDLYRAHPDWCLHIEGREHCNCRQQYVLDMSRPEVVENIYNQMYSVLSRYSIDYVKWDFNRNLTEVGSATLPADRGGELYHRFMLGTYDLMGRVIAAFPHILLENCSGGGGRFDPGMLYYSPQIWCSDDTDPIERLNIQFGTSLCYPASAVGAHISACNRTNLETRKNVALWGSFGYELDPNKLTPEEKDEVRRQIAEYHAYYDLIHNGDLYRLIYPQQDKMRCAWEIVAADGSEALVTVVVMRSIPNRKFFLRLRGLESSARYRVEGTDTVLSGALLMHGGINLVDYPHNTGDSYLIHLLRE